MRLILVQWGKEGQLGGYTDGVREAVTRCVGFTCCIRVGKHDSWLFIDSTTKMSSFVQ